MRKCIANYNRFVIWKTARFSKIGPQSVFSLWGYDSRDFPRMRMPIARWDLGAHFKQKLVKNNENFEILCNFDARHGQALRF